MFTISAQKLMRPFRFQQVFCYAKFVQKTKEQLAAEFSKKKFDIVRDSVTSHLKHRKSLTVSEWKSVVTELQTLDPYCKDMSILTRSVFAVLLTLRPPNDSMENANSFIEAFNISNDLYIKRNLIELYAKRASEKKLTNTEEQHIFDIIDVFIKDGLYVMPEMNSIVVRGLCATKEWKRAISLNSLSYNSLNVLIHKASKENEIDLVWNLLNELTKLGKQHRHLANKTILSVVKYFQQNPHKIVDNLEKFFIYCEKLEKLFDEQTARELVTLLQKTGHHGQITKIDFAGVCGTCKSKLQSVQLPSKDFKLLRSEFMNKVVKGADIYQKTTPEEWQMFEKVIHESGPFDIVMDGLNVSYSDTSVNLSYGKGLKSKNRPNAYTLANVVTQLVDDGKRVLIIGRKHMNRWPKMDFIQRKSTVFLVENISKDDVFLLYAALSSGENSYILSNDFMRQHKFAIGAKCNAIFKQWQQQHWFGFKLHKDEKIELLKPMQFKMYCHKIGNHWHLPFKSNNEFESNTFSNYELPKNWACIQLKSK